MASSENQTTESNFSAIVSTTSPSQATWQVPGTAKNHYIALQVIYSVVLLCGTVSLSLMMYVLRSSSISSTSVAVLNLIFAHFIFLVTVPFRIYYYSTNEWSLGTEWCKMVSSMIHIHLFMSFILYVVILVTRMLQFYERATHMAPTRRTYALLISVAVWILVLVIVPTVVHFAYGKDMESNNSCFNFGKMIEGAKEINYISSAVVIVVAVVLVSLQANILRVLYRRHRKRCSFQQDFGAQLKSLFFALIMLVCFVPYHVFRLYYLKNIDLEDLNEVFLSLTTFNCLDMLTFLGRRNCSVCPSRRTK